MSRTLGSLFILAASGLSLPLAASPSTAPAAAAQATQSLTLQTGDYVRLRVTVPELGTALQVHSPGGDAFRRFELKEGTHDLAFVAETVGDYRLTWIGKAGELEVLHRIPRAEQPVPARHPMVLKSPRLQALLSALAAGELKVEDAFWAEIEQEGAPLVEAKDDAEVWVTFLWRGNAHTTGIFLNWPVFSPHKEDNLFQRLGDSNVWFHTAAMPKGLRLSYKLAPNPPFGPESSRADLRRAVIATTQADPLNPRRWPPDPARDKFAVSSVIDLSGEGVSWIDTPAAARGQVETSAFASELLGNTREITVYTPHGLPQGAPHLPVLIVFDADRYLNEIPTPAILDYLIEAGEIPPAIAVFVANPTAQSRAVELPANPRFADFLADELLPWVRTRYACTADPQQTIAAGSSFGGLAATSVAFFRPDAVGAVLSQSGSYWWAPDGAEGAAGTEAEPAWLNRRLAQHERLPIRFYLEAGILETVSDIRPTNRALRDVLTAKGYPEVAYHEFPGGHDDYCWQFGLARGLKVLLQNASD